MTVTSAGMPATGAAPSANGAAPAMPVSFQRRVIRTGLLGAVIALYLCMVGIVPIFNARPLVQGVISLGQAALILSLFATGFVATRRVAESSGRLIADGAIAGGLSGVALSALVLLGSVVDVRAFLPNASPVLYGILTFNLGTIGFWIPMAAGAVLGGLAGAIGLASPRMRRSLFVGLISLFALGLFAGLIRTPMLQLPVAELARLLFASDGLTLIGAVVVLVASVGLHHVQRTRRLDLQFAALPPSRRRRIQVPLIALAAVMILVLPQGLGSFFAQVIAIVALYVMMGLGLNITLGLAGLLDLGFVAFFAVGAYTVGLLTSTAEFGIAQWPFWAAVPVAVIVAMVFGAFLGLPILSIRGDYLAIATMGFGEIIRILAGSDLLKPILGGPRGIINIPKPIEVPPDSFLAGPNQIYYIALIGAALIAFVAWRLRGSRLGRAWIAIREDEDVAEAIGINLIQTKILAYMLGAAFAGLGGAVFAALVGSIFASSIQLMVSINVASLIIVGGMGSIPGVIVGAIFLIGLPELFREFSEYRFLFYGIALIAMMQLRPEGLLPSKIVRREFQHGGGDEPPESSASPLAL